MYHTHKTREAQAWRKARIDPSRAERQTLEAIAQRGGLVIAYRNGARTTSLADGTPVSRLGSLNLNLAIELGWLQPDPQSPALLPGLPPQRYLGNERFVVEESQA